MMSTTPIAISLRTSARRSLFLRGPAMVRDPMSDKPERILRRGLQRRNKTKQNGREQRYGYRQCQHAAIEANVPPYVERFRHEAIERANTRISHRHSADCACDPKQQTLHQQLTDHSGAPASERNPCGDLAAPSGIARQQ